MAKSCSASCCVCFELTNDTMLWCWDCDVYVCLTCGTKPRSKANHMHLNHLLSEEAIEANGVHNKYRQRRDCFKATLENGFRRFSNRPFIAMWASSELASSSSAVSLRPSAPDAAQLCFPSCKAPFSWLRLRCVLVNK